MIDRVELPAQEAYFTISRAVSCQSCVGDVNDPPRLFPNRAPVSRLGSLEKTGADGKQMGI